MYLSLLPTVEYTRIPQSNSPTAKTTFFASEQ